MISLYFSYGDGQLFGEDPRVCVCFFPVQFCFFLRYFLQIWPVCVASHWSPSPLLFGTRHREIPETRQNTRLQKWDLGFVLQCAPCLREDYFAGSLSTSRVLFTGSPHFNLLHPHCFRKSFPMFCDLGFNYLLVVLKWIFYSESHSLKVSFVSFFF